MDEEVKVKGLEKRLEISYSPLTRDLEIVANDFTTFEVLGILEAAKAMVADRWCHGKKHTDG